MREAEKPAPPVFTPFLGDAFAAAQGNAGIPEKEGQKRVVCGAEQRELFWSGKIKIDGIFMKSGSFLLIFPAEYCIINSRIDRKNKKEIHEHEQM